MVHSAQCKRQESNSSFQYLPLIESETSASP